MDGKTRKEGFIDKIQVKRRQLERYLFYFEKDSRGVFVASERPKFGRREMLQPGVVGEWSLKDVLAHLIDWEERFIDWYEAGLRGEVPEVPSPTIDWDDAEVLDQDISQELRACTLEVVLAEFPQSFGRVLEVVQSISEEELFSPGYFAWTRDAKLADYAAFCTHEHYDWAKKHVRRWRRAHSGKYLNKDEVLDRVRVERRRLEHNLAALTEEEMVEPGVIGEWSVKDILAHLVDWEQRFLGWYEAGLRGEVPETPAPGLSWGELDLLNQLIYEKHRDRDLVDVMDEFSRSYEQVLGMVQGMSEDDMFEAGRYAWLGNENLLGYILANTANHYRWAKTQIRRWMKAR